MGRHRLSTLLWTLALGLTTGVVVSTAVRTPDSVSVVAFTLGVTVVGALVLAGLLWTRWDDWMALGPWLGYAVYFSALFLGTVVLSGFARLFVDIPWWFSLGLQLSGSAIAFAIAVWLCFYGGAATTLHWLAPRLGIEI